ncbi:MAG: potassium-transporting ATPase subunit C [Nitrososphaeraceae archaeon]|nr:potassium-transporting ATPase subunit C [Nitrososphaeraceae archaeon]
MNLENLNLNKTSTVDPHITPEDAYAQVPRISKATGLPEYTLKTILQFNIEKNKVTNVLVFAPNYVNVLEVNVELISGYPDVYQDFVNKKLSGLN